MKKLITVFLAVAFVFSFVGCGLFQGDSTKVELTKTPKTQYVVGEELGSVEFGLKVTGGTTAGEYNFTYAEYTADTLPEGLQGKVTITNFKTDTAGNFTATISINNGEATCTFDYTVTAQENTSGFAGGNGTSASPYQIATAEQFANIVLKGDQSKYTYYKLVADIDFSSVDFNSLTNADGKTYNQLIDCGYALYPRVPEYSFVGSLDGSAGSYNFKLKNFTATQDNISLFGNIANGSFSNIDVSGFNTVGHRSGAFGSNAYYDANGNAGATVSFKNVNILSNNKLSFGGFLAQAKKTKSAAFENCTMAGQIISDGDNVGGYIGAATSSTQITFTGCTMTGSVVGVNHVGGFVGYNGIELGINFAGCTASGTITAYGAAKLDKGNLVNADTSCGQFIAGVAGLENASKVTFDSNCAFTGTLNNRMNQALPENIVSINGTTATLNTSDVDSSLGISYYRVMYLGAVNHFAYDTEMSAYYPHFKGGYMTPLFRTDKLGNGSEFDLYTCSDVYSYVPAGTRTILFNEKTHEMQVGTPGAAVQFTDQISLEGKLVYNGTNGSSETSLLLYKGRNLSVYVFAFNEAGEIVAARSVYMSSNTAALQDVDYQYENGTLTQVNA